MKLRFRDILHLFELGRLEVVPALIGNIWLMTFIAQKAEGIHWSTSELTLRLILATLIALGLAGLGIALNDALDAKHDRTFAPYRPIPSGRVEIRVAIVAAMLSLIASIAASIWLGKWSTIITLLTVGGILFYNLTGRFMPAVSVVSLGLITGLVMLIPSARPVYAWPIVLAMTHVMFCSTIRHWLAGKRPRITAKDGFGICAGWLFWTMLVVGVLRPHEHNLKHVADNHAARLLFGPVLAIIIFTIITAILLRHFENMNFSERKLIGNRFARIAGIWLLVYNLSWLITLGLWWQAWIMASLLLVSLLTIWIGRLLRIIFHVPPAYGLTDKP